MISQRPHPHLLEINTLLFTRRLSEKYKKKLTLLTIPEKEWKTVAEQGFDFVWLMGVWKRSSGARQKALAEPNLRKHFDSGCPGWSEADIQGSAYAVFEYKLDPLFGTEEDLTQLKTVLNRCGLGLILDYVPNHMAFDSPFTVSNPANFIRGTREDLHRSPDLFYEMQGNIFAYGRDPCFPPWNDTVQVNYFSPSAREEASRTLLQIAQYADGVRCDMAMLGLSHIFEKTWGPLIKTKKPPAEFWVETIKKVRQESKDFVFIAEAYWDLEWELQQLGFDFTYDKKFYDRLLRSPAREVRSHLQAEINYQEKSLRFIENHDEVRAVTAFGREKSMAAAAATLTVPGLRLLYDGQMQGKARHISVQLGCEPAEKEDKEIQDFYRVLLEYADQPALHDGHWRLLNTGGSDLLAWSWEEEKQLRIIVINMSASAAQGHIIFPALSSSEKKIKLKDKMTGKTYERDVEEMRSRGLYVDLGPWKVHLFETAL